MEMARRFERRIIRVRFLDGVFMKALKVQELLDMTFANHTDVPLPEILDISKKAKDFEEAKALVQAKAVELADPKNKSNNAKKGWPEWLISLEETESLLTNYCHVQPNGLPMIELPVELVASIRYHLKREVDSLAEAAAMDPQCAGS